MDEVRNYEYEEEINLKQLLIYVIRKWRIMLAAAVVLGILLGGAKTAKGFLDLQDPEKVEESLKESELAQQNYETAKNQLANQMAEYNRQLDDYQRYAENSLYMKIDPYAVYKESVTYVVTTDYQILPNMTYQTLNWMGPVLSAYSSVATSVTLDELSSEGRAGLSEEWDADSLDKLIKVETNVNDGKLTITASAESEARAKAILQAVKARVEKNQKSIAEAAGEHKLSVISEKSTIAVDQTIINEREARLRSITALREAADKAAEKYDKLREPDSGELSVSNIVKSGIKFAILGFISGVILTCCCFGVGFLLDGILHDPNSLKNLFQVKVLAFITKNENKKGIDRALDHLESLSSARSSSLIGLYTTAASLDAIGEKRILISGTAEKTEIERFSKELTKMVSKPTIQYGPDLLRNQETLEKLKLVDAVVLVEQKDVSKLTDIQRELEIVHYLGKTMEGFLLIV